MAASWEVSKVPSQRRAPWLDSRISATHLPQVLWRTPLIEKFRINRIDGISKVLGTVCCVAGAPVITRYNGPVIYSPAPHLNRPAPMFVSLGDARGKNWTLVCIYLIGHCLSWSGWLVLQAPVLKKYPARLSVTSYTCFFGLIQFLVIAAFMQRDLKYSYAHWFNEIPPHFLLLSFTVYIYKESATNMPVCLL